MAEMHAGGSGVRFWAVGRGETHHGTCSTTAGGRPEGNGMEGVVRWWWRLARGEVRSTYGAWGGVGGAVPWPEVPGDCGAPVDMAAASDSLPGATALSTRRSRPVLVEGVAPAVQLDRALEARHHGSSTVAARSRGARSARLEEKSDGKASGEEKNSFVSLMDYNGG
jgi:hypothetical protein